MHPHPKRSAAAPAPAKPRGTRRTAIERVVAGVVFVPLFIIITRAGGYAFLALIDLVIVLGMLEFYAMMRAKGMHPYRGIGVASGITLSTYIFFRSGQYANFVFTFILIALMGLELARKDNRRAAYHVSTTIFGVIYVAYLSSHFVLLRELPNAVGVPYSQGASFVFLVVAVTWASDTGAYTIGSLFGSHTLLPRVSRHKTWEGALGGVLFGAVAGWISSVSFAGYLKAWEGVVIGILSSLVGLLGDLFESMLKRDADIKDTSNLIPGHGGVLDRFDSLLFTAPLIYYFLKFVIFQ
ncbi:MAG TPA: phosphatidate cytidylyltransferase [Candidatus Krumholzibacteria bacterium]|nr:phosphatidate cytidylyltransferase [Candidatus Krumholzibacteria bacterium]